MDADDICVPNRFEQQLRYFMTQEVDIVGGNIEEFVGEVSHVVGHRMVPERDSGIKHYLKERCPFNQMTVMFKKSKVEQAGGYLDWYCNEDYYLWIRMTLNGCVMGNTGTVLCHVRVGEEMYQRRGGWKYFCSEAKLQGFMLKKNLISVPTYLMNVAKRLIVQMLLPNKIRGWVFQKFARS